MARITNPLTNTEVAKAKPKDKPYRLYDGNEQTSQGFRAIARTLLEERLEFEYALIDMQLAHKVVDGNGRAYNRLTFLSKRKVMMQSWADYLDSLKPTTD